MAAAQMRGTARLTRTWVIGILVIATTLCVSAFYAYAHGALGTGLIWGGFAPRLLLGEIGINLLWLPLAGAFDFREMLARSGLLDTTYGGAWRK